MTIIFSFGKSGGFYIAYNRICLWFVAITFYPWDFDKVIGPALDEWQKNKVKK